MDISIRFEETMKYVTKTTTTMAVVLVIAVPLIVIPTSAIAWPYYGVGGGVGGYDEGWRGGGGYHGSWDFTGPYCGYPAEPCRPTVAAVRVPVPVAVPTPVPVPVPVAVPVPSCGCPPPPCCPPVATPYQQQYGLGGSTWYPPQTAYAQTIGQSQTQINNVSGSSGAYVINSAQQEP
jgi:hypothetical protein